jgi:hypothetical protein
MSYLSARVDALGTLSRCEIFDRQPNHTPGRLLPYAPCSVSGIAMDQQLIYLSEFHAQWRALMVVSCGRRIRHFRNHTRRRSARDRTPSRARPVPGPAAMGERDLGSIAIRRRSCTRVRPPVRGRTGRRTVEPLAARRRFHGRSHRPHSPLRFRRDESPRQMHFAPTLGRSDARWEQGSSPAPRFFPASAVRNNHYTVFET